MARGDGSPLVVSMSPKPVREFKPDLTPQPENLKKTKSYSIVGQSFSAKETDFWRQYGITPEILKTLRRRTVSPFLDTPANGM
jgi:hypothetical protein